MGIATQQDIKPKKITSEPWSVRALFPVKAMASAISKTLVSIFDFILVYLVIIISITELLGRDVSWAMWVFITLVFLAVLSEHNKVKINDKK
jgi:hypothetical protein